MWLEQVRQKLIGDHVTQWGRSSSINTLIFMEHFRAEYVNGVIILNLSVAQRKVVCFSDMTGSHEA